MKKFTKIVEKIESNNSYIIKAEIELEVKAENEGEAGYLADSILQGIEESTGNYIINDIAKLKE
ncbi:MAG: hypothetical protein M0R46_06795 [Candidatus Muirbacterium halophilum]|nr:hypothetical protein [Candidatus Muirbacterium halophilum]